MLRITDLTKIFNSTVRAVDGLNLEVASGEVYTMLGANGAGKTTTINLILNFIEPTSGEIWVNDINVVKNPLDAKRNLAYVSENVMLYENLNAYQNLGFFAELAGKKQIRFDEMNQILNRVGLTKEQCHRKLKTYSKGMRQKCGIAIAILKQAKLILLDEPTSGLDPKSGKEFLDLLCEFREEGKTVFMTTHDIFRARAIADKIGIMNDGKLLREITRSEIESINLEKIYIEYIDQKTAA
ncbi:ATP-binding cassette domain-containing protein [candidate division KSB1 bacterium]|nr:ATP-binding cassette domain-containing protein [candidate division KSB1 bacterium]